MRESRKICNSNSRSKKNKRIVGRVTFEGRMMVSESNGIESKEKKRIENGMISDDPIIK